MNQSHQQPANIGGPGPSSMAHQLEQGTQTVQDRQIYRPVPPTTSHLAHRPPNTNILPNIRPKQEPPSSSSSQEADPDGEGGIGLGAGSERPDANGDAATDASGKRGSIGKKSGKGPGEGKVRRSSVGSKEKDKDGEKAKRIAACDVCRMRKVRCVKTEDSPMIDGHAQRCMGCSELNRDCSYNYVSKKPGPPNSFAKPGTGAAAQASLTAERYAPYPQPTPSGGHKNGNLPPTTIGSMAVAPPSFERHYSTSSNRSESHGRGRAESDLSGPTALPLVASSAGFPMSPPALPFGGFLNQPISGQPPLSSSGSNQAIDPIFAFASGSNGLHDDFVEFRNTSLDGVGGGNPGPRRGMSGVNPLVMDLSGDISPRLSGNVGSATNQTAPGISALLHDFSPGKSLSSVPGSLNGFNEEDSLFMPWIVGATPPSFPPSTNGGGPGNEGGGGGHILNGHINQTSSFNGHSDIDMGGRTGSEGLDWTDMGDGDDHIELGDSLALLGSGSALGLNTQSSSFRSHVGSDFIGLSSGQRSAATHMRSQSFSHPLQQSSSHLSAAPPLHAGWQLGASPAAAGAVEVPALRRNAGSLPDLPLLEDVTSWSTIMTFLSLYHEHLYPLLPLMHWPSFSQQLVARHDRKDLVFRAFVLSLVDYSILQLPRSVIPERYNQHELLLLHKRCHQYSQQLQPRTYEPAELIHVSTLYCDHIYLGSMGKDNAANVVLAEAMRLAIAMGLHDETIGSGSDLNEIDRETRRRVFWVLYGSDRTIAALISCPMLLSDEDVFVGDILAVDDNLITAAGAFPQPSGRTPVLAGFLHVTKIFRLLSRVLQLVRRCARPFSPVDEVLVDPRTLIQSLQSLLDDLPPALRINGQIEEPRNRTDTVAFDTCKANILVTQVLVRFAIYQYAILKQQGRPDQCLDELTEDVLRRLHAMSSESLAANGESIRHKVLFIASSLLNKYPSDNAGHDHVAEFLSVYNKILTNQCATGVEPRNATDNHSQAG